MASVSFTGKISPNFDLKNMVSPYTKIIINKLNKIKSWKKKFKICQILKKRIFKSPDFHDKFHYIAMNFLNSISFSMISSAPDVPMGEV
jgi:hypothetical protein